MFKNVVLGLIYAAILSALIVAGVVFYGFLAGSQKPALRADGLDRVMVMKRIRGGRHGE